MEGLSWSASPRLRITTATATRTAEREPVVLRRPDQGPRSAVRVPVHAVGAGGWCSRRDHRGGGRVVHGPAAAELRGPHARCDGGSGSYRCRARRAPGVTWLLRRGERRG